MNNPEPAGVRFPVTLLVAVCLVLDAFVAFVAGTETDIVSIALTPLAAVLPFLLPLAGTFMARAAAATRARQSLPPLRPGSLRLQAIIPLIGLPQAALVALVVWTRLPAIAALVASVIVAAIWWPRAGRLDRIATGELPPMFAGEVTEVSSR